MHTDVTKEEAPFHAIHVGAAADELPRCILLNFSESIKGLLFFAF
jgi:protein-L-isoaspartate O-methyltransferase